MAVAALVATGILHIASAADALSLAGQWRFQLDRQDVGIKARWFGQRLPDTIKLPGSLPEQGIGDPVTVNTKWTGGIVDKSWFTAPEHERYRQPGKVKLPFWLQPDKYYAGVAWYQNDVEIPKVWEGKRTVLFLERPHWETRVWLDGKPMGTNNSLATPHEYDLGQLAPGKHTVSIRVDNRMVIDVGENSHCVSDHTQGNWNGIVGRIELRATPLVWIEELQVHPDGATGSLMLKGRIGNISGRPGKGEVDFYQLTSAVSQVSRTNMSVFWSPTGGVFAVALPFNRYIRPWDEFAPSRCEISARLVQEGIGRRTTVDSRQTSFGFREISTKSTQFTINGHKTFLRGTLECAIFPKTGHPPMEIEEWRRIIRVAKSYGLNLIRFHSWCPPEAAFIAADELGFYFHVETCWPNQSTTLGDGKPVDQWIYDETDRILKAYGNHPSFLLMAAGNEPGGPKANAYLAKYVTHYKALDPRRLWTSAAGWPELSENQFHVSPSPRIQSWGEGLRSRINAHPPETTTDYHDYIVQRNVPVISHEIGQWCVYPYFDEIKKYTGYLKPKNFEIFRDTLASHHMSDLTHQFLLASGKLQTLCYKEEIESALRTPGMGGFELLDLHDFPGQGTALVGVLDPFWEEKGYVTAREFSRFCDSTVPLARLKKRVFTTDEKLEAEIEVAHFGPLPLNIFQDTFGKIDGGMERFSGWALTTEEGSAVASGMFPDTRIPIGSTNLLGHVSLALKEIPAPARYKFSVFVGGNMWTNGFASRSVRAGNDWDVWVYPPVVDTSVPTGITVTTNLNAAAVATLNAGGKVLLLIPPERVAPDKRRGKVALGFSSIFWNTAWTQQQPPHTLGILCDPKHPLFADFPTEFHSNWQWWYLISRAGAMILDDLPPKLRPTVQVIDDWVTVRKLGLVVEGKLGGGKLLVCSVDLEHDLAGDPVRRQFRHSLLRYMAGDHFAPKHIVTAEQVRGLIAAPTTLQRVGVRSFSASSEEPGYEAGRTVDGDAQTFWHTAFTGGPPALPQEFVLRFDHPISLAGFRVLPRQDGNRNGWIQDYAFYVSMNDRDWGEPVSRGSFAADSKLKTVKLNQPVTARYVRLVALSTFDEQPFASLAEFDVIEDGK